MIEEGSELAVVVPAIKARFLSSALASIEQQTDRRFRIYVGDDFSPEPVGSVVKSFVGEVPIVYERFAENLGSKSLTAQWSRCLALSTEPWVWLFSDDDVMDPDCVAEFYRTLERTGGRYDVYRFDTVFIDAGARVIQLNPPHPDHESWKNFAYHLLRGMRVSTAQEMIFSRAAFARIGGFVDLPLAWNSDHATLMALAGEKGICRIPGPKVRFRRSGQNISSVADRNVDALKLRASMDYVRWFLHAIAQTPDPEFPLSDADLKAVAFESFKNHLEALHTPFFPRQCREIVRFVGATWGEPRWRSWARLVKLNLALIIHQGRCRKAK